MNDVRNYGPPIDATGTVRRLRALVATGHRQIDLASRLGVQPPYVSVLIHGKLPHVTARTFAAVHMLFVELWEAPVLDGSGDYPRAIARANGWVGPLAWDEIDDPTELPNIRGMRPEHTGPAPDGKHHINTDAVNRAMKAERVTLTHLERLVAVTKLHSRGRSAHHIAAVLHVDERIVHEDKKILGLAEPGRTLTREVDAA